MSDTTGKRNPHQNNTAKISEKYIWATERLKKAFGGLKDPTGYRLIQVTVESRYQSRLVEKFFMGSINF